MANTELPTSGEVTPIPVDLVFPNPLQPRKKFKTDTLRELGGSIKKSGLAQPITVTPRKMPDGRDGFMIVAGERRWRASCLVGLPTIDALVKPMSEEKVREVALLENLNREDLNQMEEANAYQHMIDNGETVASLTKTLGYRSEDLIRERLALLKLAPRYQEMLVNCIITPYQARQLAYLSFEGQDKLWAMMSQGKLETSSALRRACVAIYDEEHQLRIFKGDEMSEKDKASLSRVDQFLQRADGLIGLLTDEDLKAIPMLNKSDAPLCLAKLALLSSVISRLALSLETSKAKSALRKEKAA